MPAARPAHLLSLVLVWGAALVLAGATLGGFAGTARADCQPDAPVNNDTVTCSADDADGFDAGAAVDLEVTVEATATVDNGGAASVNAINLTDGNTVTVEAGAVITADGAASHGIEIGSDNNSVMPANGTDDGVFNSGEITVTGAGSGAILGVDDNDITNDGDINAGVVSTGSDNAFGIRVGNDNNVTNSATGTIDVTGTSTAATNAVGIEVGNDNTVTNESGGAITVNGLDAVGILGGTGNEVINDGSIGAGAFLSGSDNATGIRVGDDSNVTNSVTGSIQAAGEGAVGIEVGSETMGTQNTLTNEGSVTVSGVNGAATGLRVGDDYDVMIMEGSGVTVTGDLDAMGMEDVIGVDLGADTTLTNDGDIDANLLAGAGTAVRANGGAGGTTTITNTANGRIRVNADDGIAAILGSSDVEDVFNHGRIDGDVSLGDGDDSLTLFTTSLVFGNLDGGDGTGDALGLTIDPDEMFPFNALDVNTVQNFETLTINSGEWTLFGTLDAEGNPTAGAVMLDGGLRLLDGALDLVNTLTVTSAGGTGYEQVGSSLRLRITPDVLPANDVLGNLIVSGGGDIDLDGGTNELVFVFATPVPTSRTLRLLEATGGGSVLGEFEIVPADTTLLDFEIIYLANAVDLQITRASYTDFANTPNQVAAASYLDRVLAAGGGDILLAQSLVELDTLSAAQLGPAYDAFHPEGYDVHTSAVAKLGLSFARAATQPRLNCKPAFFGLDPGPLRDIPCGRTGFTAWMNLLFSDFDREPGNDFFESEGSTQAVAGGFDWRPDRRIQLTGYIGIGSADLDVDGVGDGDVQSFEIGTAVHARLGNARLRGAFGYGRGEHEQSRAIRIGAINLVTESEFDSHRIQGLLDMAWLFEWRGFQVEPRAAMDVVWVQEEAFEETDTLGLQLEVDERENTIVSTEFGSRFRYRHYQSPYKDSGLPYTQGTWTPEVSAAWRSTWVGAKRELDARIGGAASSAGSVTADAEDNEQGAAVGGRITFQPHGSGGSFSVGYDGFFGDKGTTHRFDAKLEVYF